MTNPTMSAGEREFLGKLVRHVWVKWAEEQPSPKPSWLVPWSDLDDDQREVDMRIGEKVKEVCFPRWQEAIEDAEQAAYERAAQVADSPANFAEAYTVERKYVARVCRKVAAAIRALAQQPEEVG